MNRYTNIGEAVITSSLTGKARVRIVQGQGVKVMIWLAAVGALLAVAVAVWLLWSSHSAGTVAEGEDAAAPAAPAGTSVPVPQPAPREAPTPAEVIAPPAPAAEAQQPANSAEYAQQLAQQGKYAESIEAYRNALLQEPGNDTARQAMVELLLKARRTGDAERALQLGIKYNPKRTTYNMQLAHLQAGRGALAQALDTLMKGLPNAKQQADYQAFIASLLQRLGRHPSAVVYYKQALELQPGTGEWLMGMGVSLKAQGRGDDAREAFRKAQASGNLSSSSQAFVEGELKQQPPAAAASQPAAM